MFNQTRKRKMQDFIPRNCLQAHIIPKFLKFRIPNNDCFEPTVVHNFQRRLLKQELSKAKETVLQHNASLDAKRSALQQSIPETLIPSVVVYTRMAVHSTRNEVTTTLQKKLDNLSQEQERPLFHVQDTVKFFDIGIVPPKYVIDTLTLGPRNPVLTKFDQKEILAEIDIVLSKLNERIVSNEVINDINIATLQYIKICCKQKTPRKILMTRRFLKEHDLLAVPFDKGIGICVMKASTYKEKLGAILQLEQFVKVTNTRKNAKDLCFKEEERINEALESLVETGVLNENLSNEMKSKG